MINLQAVARAARCVKVASGLSRFRKDRRGIAAVEFAFLALPFFMIIFAILESALIFIADMTLEQAVARTARTVRVGEVAGAQASRADFRKQLCGEINLLLSCDKIQIDLRTYPTFAAIPRRAPVEAGALQSEGFQYEPGGPGQIMALRAYYEWPIVTNVIQGALSNLSGGKYLLSATAVFKTEPF